MKDLFQNVFPNRLQGPVFEDVFLNDSPPVSSLWSRPAAIGHWLTLSLKSCRAVCSLGSRFKKRAPSVANLALSPRIEWWGVRLMRFWASRKERAAEEKRDGNSSIGTIVLNLSALCVCAGNVKDCNKEWVKEGSGGDAGSGAQREKDSTQGTGTVMRSNGEVGTNASVGSERAQDKGNKWPSCLAERRAQLLQATVRSRTCFAQLPMECAVLRVQLAGGWCQIWVLSCCPPLAARFLFHHTRPWGWDSNRRVPLLPHGSSPSSLSLLPPA